MAVTVSGKNYAQISSCDTATSGGEWDGSPLVDSANKKEGAASISDILKSSGDNDWVFTPTASVDLSGIKHLRIWMILTQGSLINTFVNGGIQVSITDGVNTGYYYVGGRDTYPGGWYNFVVDVSKDVDAGTKPVSMNAITEIGIRINLISGGKNVDNTWVDNLCVCDGLITYGDDAGDYYDFDDIFSVCDDPSTGGWGILTKIGGVYFLTGSIEFGDSAGSSGTKFQAKSQVVIFENRYDAPVTGSLINTNLMNFTIVDNGTGTTEFVLGEKSGTQGISGCTIRVQNTAQLAKFDIDASTDTDVDNFKLYGSTFLDADSVSLPATAVNVEVLNCNFESCGEITPDTCVMKYCNFISANDNGIQVSSATLNVSDSNFINCPNGIEFTITGTWNFVAMKFSGNTVDIDNTSGELVTINKDVNSDPISSTGNTTIQASVNITIHVVDEDNNNIENAQTAVYKTSDKTKLMNEDTLASGIATEVYTGSTPIDIYVRVRKSSTGSTKYVAYSTTGAITSGGYSAKVTLKEDSNA